MNGKQYNPIKEKWNEALIASANKTLSGKREFTTADLPFLAASSIALHYFCKHQPAKSDLSQLMTFLEKELQKYKTQYALTQIDINSPNSSSFHTPSMTFAGRGTTSLNVLEEYAKQNGLVLDMERKNIFGQNYTDVLAEYKKMHNLSYCKKLKNKATEDNPEQPPAKRKTKQPDRQQYPLTQEYFENLFNQFRTAAENNKGKVPDELVLKYLPSYPSSIQPKPQANITQIISNRSASKSPTQDNIAKIISNGPTSPTSTRHCSPTDFLNQDWNWFRSPS